MLHTSFIQIVMLEEFNFEFYPEGWQGQYLWQCKYGGIPSAPNRVNSHHQPYDTSPCPHIQDITVSGHSRHHRLRPYERSPSPAIHDISVSNHTRYLYLQSFMSSPPPGKTPRSPAETGICYSFKPYGLQIALSKATYIISTGMSVFHESVQERTWRLCPSWQATPPAETPPIMNMHQCQHQTSQCPTIIAPCWPRIQCVSIYSLYRKWPPKAWPPPFNANQHDWQPPEVDSPLHEDARLARQVQCILVVHHCLPWPHTTL